MSRALQEFARQSGVQIIFFSRGMEGYEVAPLSGKFTASAALTRLLSGSELTFRELNPKTIEVRPKSGIRPRTGGDSAVRSAVTDAMVRSVQPVPRGILDEIVVTAQKREEAAQQVPVSIDVVSGDRLSEEGVRDVKDIGKASTELEINSRIGQATVIGLRGMQQSGFSPTGDTLVATHLDGAYLSNFWGLNGLMFDLERVEILAGPQGTLYGRNTAAGAINLISKRPGREFAADSQIEFGNFNTQRINAGITLPFGNTLSMRVAGTRYRRDALYGDGGAATDQWGGRLSAIWTPTDRDSLYFTYDHVRTGGTTESGGLVDLNEDVNSYDVLTNTFTAMPPASVAGFQGLEGPNPYDNLAYITQRGLVFVGDMESTHRGAMGQYTREFDEFDLVLQYSHRRLEGISRTATRSVSAFSSTSWPQVSQSDVVELRLVSDDRGPLTWVGGLFWFDGSTIHGNATPNFLAPTGTFTGFVNTATGPVSTLGSPSPDPTTGLDVPGCPCTAGFYPVNGKATSYAAYGQLTWTPASLPQWHFTGGLRYTKDDKETVQGYYINGVLYSLWVPDAGSIPDYLARSIITPAQALPGLPATILHTDGRDSWDAIQWRIGAEYDVNPTSMVYGTVATGYKSGGFAYGSTPKLKPENLLAVEFGTKNRFFENTLQVNAATWFYDYSDLEQGVSRAIPPPFPTINNVPQTTIGSVASVGKVHMAGFSLDLDWLVTKRDRVNLSVTHVYSSIKDGYEMLDGVRNQVFNEGERLGDAPKWQLLGRYMHTFELANAATIAPAVKYQYQTAKYDGGAIPAGSVPAGATVIDPSAGTYNLERKNPGQTIIPAQGVLDFQIKYASADSRWNVTAYVHNVTDELDIKNITYGANPMSGAATGNYGHTTALLGEPRTYGVILGMQF